jgi:hypothetical protein
MEQMTMLFEMMSEIREDQKKILVQTTKTNGRVTALEEKCKKYGSDIDSLKATDNSTKGSNKIIWIVLGSAGTICLLLFQTFILKK